jgi:DNA-binding MarR family transcriptional regulator
MCQKSEADNDWNGFIGRLLGKASHAWRERMNRNLCRAGYSLTIEHLVIVSVLQQRQGVSQHFFVEVLGRNRTHITRLVDHLESECLLTRRTDTADRRQKLLYPTEKASTVFPALQEVAHETAREATVDISSPDLAACKRVLRRIFENLASGACASSWAQGREVE